MFFDTSFSKISFSPRSFFFGAKADESSAAAGMRRLQLYQLQEDALKKESDTIKQQVKEIVIEQEQEKTASTRARKKKTRRVSVATQKVRPDIPFKRKPIYSAPTTIIPVLPVWLSLVSLEVHQWYASIIPLWEKHCVTILKKQSAANDAEFRIRLLLLAA